MHVTSSLAEFTGHWIHHRPKSLALQCLCLGVCLFFTTSATAATLLDIKGLSEPLAENVQLFVGKPVRDDQRGIDRYVKNLPDQVRQSLSALGYYSADVDVSTAEDANDPENTVVTLNVKANDPVRINEVIIQVNGPARLDGEFMPVLGSILLRRNAVFVSNDYEATKGVLLDRAQDLGYFNLTFSTSEVRVSRRQLTADIKLIVESEERFVFGPIQFDQNIFSERFLNRWLTFAEGGPYSSEKVGQLTQNLQASGYFASVRVTPQRDRRYGLTVPVTIGLRLKDENQIGIGIGYATDTKARTKLTWSKPHINRLGHSAEASLGLSRLKQNITLSYRIPRSNKPLNNFYGIEYGLQNDDEKDKKSFLSTLNFRRVSLTSYKFIESIFLRWERERFTIASIERETDLIMPGISYSRNRSKGSPFPRWGQASSVSFQLGSTKALSTIDFYKSVVNFKYLRAVSDRNTLIGTLQYGAISSNDFDFVPVSQRFFAGGDRSIRGFKFRDVAPRNIEDEIVGGRYLEVVNLEYTYRFLDAWSVALFVDAGRAFNNFDQAYSAGAGIGIRWQTPVGPLRIDIAKPVSDGDGDKGVRLHISLGPDL